VVDQVSTSGIDLSADSANITAADDRAVAADVGEGRSLEFDGTADFLSKTSSLTDLDIANTFTMMVWMKHETAGGDCRIFDTLEPGLSNQSRINMRLRGDVAGDPFQVAIRDNGGTNLKLYQFNGVSADEDWYNFATSWSGTDLKGYRNGIEDASPTKTNDDAVTLVERSRQAFVGRNSSASNQFFQGTIGCIALWSSVLTDNEILELSLRGLEFDLRQAGQVYDSQDDLVIYYYFGFNPDSALGTDLGSSATNLTATSLDETDTFGDNPRVR
jgi:hypothetical protein